MANNKNRNFGFNADESGNLANAKGQFIEFFHVPSGTPVAFKAFLTLFSDQYQSDWNDEPVFGRMDAISTFRGTKRKISLGWDVVAGSIGESVDNLRKCSLLLSMLYPTYEKVDAGATSISTSPLFRVKFMNLIQNSAKGDNGESAEISGLLGKVSGFTYEPNLDHGFFDPQSEILLEDISTLDNPETALSTKRNHLYPQTINLTCEFTVIHEHKLGWVKGSEQQNPDFQAFPYSERKPISSGANPKKEDQKTTIGANVAASSKKKITKSGSGR